MEGGGGLRVFTLWSGWRLYLALVLVGILGTAVESMTLDVAQGEEGCVIINANKGDNINGNYEVLTPRSLKDVMVILRRSDDGSLLYRHEGLREHYIWTKPTAEAGEYELCFLNEAHEAMTKLRNTHLDDQNRLTGLDARRRKKNAEKKDEQTTQSSSDDFMDDANSTPETSWSGDDFDAWYSAESPTTTFGFGLRLGDGPDFALREKDTPEDEAVVFLKDEASLLVQTLSMFGDHESYMRGREEWHRENMTKASSRLLWCTLIEAAVLVWVSWSQLSYIRRFFETKRIL